jgi:CheY-like chemotaxis protein
MAPKRILVIDDNDDCIVLIKLVLEYEFEWQVLTACNGKEGISIAKSELPDVILLDIIMPGLDGLDVYELLKLNITTCLIPIIFMTAMNLIETTLKRQIFEKAKVITKPLNIYQLSNQLSEVLENHNH